MPDKQIRISESKWSEEDERMFALICDKDARSQGDEVAWLIRQRYAAMISQPSLLTIEEAQNG